MAANIKYSPAAQRDSLDDTAMYSQAPPSYTDRPSASTDQAALLGGGPRSSEDNIPDDFKFGGNVSEATIDIRMAFVRKVYSILTVQLLATAVLSSVSFFNDSYKDWIQSNQWMVWVSLFGAIGFMLLTFWKRKSYPMNLLFLGGFTAFEAYSVSVIVSFYQSRIVLQAILLTAGIFIALTLFACQTKYDFVSWQPYLFGALWFLIIFGFMASFFRSSTTELIYSGAAALIFSGYILVDTQLIMRHYHVEEEIAAAISLYLDIINLFLAILRILNSQNNN
jgi:FtsH-binding integral membrane protein